MTDKVFEIAFVELMDVEKGYVNDPRDPGGETKYGVSKRSYPELDIKNITIAKAKEIYKKNYWDKCRCDLLPDALSIVVSDTAYNSGNVRAIKLLQETLMTSQDGIVGNVTLSIANHCNVKQAIETYKELRMEFLKSCRTWDIHGKGWTKRVDKVHTLAEQYL